MNLTIENKIIQILLNEGDSIKKVDVCKILNISKEELDQKILEIRNLLAILNLNLVENDLALEISLSLEINQLISKQKIEDLRSDLSESSLQTISVILYRARATKAEIDFVRGVDSGRSIKNLLVRGLIDHVEEKSKKYYIVSTDTLKFLSITQNSDIPDFSDVNEKLKNLIEG